MTITVTITKKEFNPRMDLRVSVVAVNAENTEGNHSEGIALPYRTPTDFVVTPHQEINIFEVPIPEDATGADVEESNPTNGY